MPTSETQASETIKGEDVLAEYSDDTLATMAEDFAKEAERLGRLARGAHQELLVRMLQREATKLDTEHWTGTVKPGPIHHTVDDLPRFRYRLQDVVSDDEIEAAFVQPPPPPMRVDMRQVNELYKRGGEIAAIVDEERRSVRGESVLKLERKA